MIEVKVPGKLYIAGEYAVVNPGNKAVLISVDKFITIKLKKSKHKGSVKSYSNIRMIWSRQDDQIVVDQKDDRFEYIFSAMDIAEKYILQKGYSLDFYDIEVNSDLESKDGIKYGLGSSAAIVVAVIKSILEYYKVEYSKMDLFKLSAIASIKLNPNGSCGDIASAVYNGLIKYTSFDREKILNRLKTDTLKDIVESDWDSLEIENILLNNEYDFIIGWTKSPASSINLVNKAKNNISKNIKFYKDFLYESNKCVDEFVKGYIKSSFETVKHSLEKNRELLRQYAENYNVLIERDNLFDLVEIAKKFGLASKTSGAGGGDCGIAISYKGFDVKSLEKEWKENKITKLDLSIHEG